MGVPAFFRWLSLKYPQIVSHCYEEKPNVIDENTTIPVDCSQPNPNKMEFDNLYLDMNGIIHPCTHPENKPAPKNEQEMFVEIFDYIDRIMSVCRPRRVLYMAVDGVAPRAKMNQQRSRRFRAGKENREKHLSIENIRKELTLIGANLPTPKDASERFDSNCITPGTPFMDRLSTALQYYVYQKLHSDPGWKNLQIILSDANAPGEGEHKIMDYIRRQRASPSHDPNTKHCLCGADADLIMLGLATHEPYFTIIREEFKPNQPRPCEICGQFEHEMSQCQGLPSAAFDMGGANKSTPAPDTEFIFIHLAVLRDYLRQELTMPGLPFKYEFERAVDDWVFMCFFVGNDFLPHLPSLEIRERAIDRLVALYKSTVVRTKGWLTDAGKVDLERVQIIMTEVSVVEDEIFQSRRENEVKMRGRNANNKRRRDQDNKRQRLNHQGQSQNTGETMVALGKNRDQDPVRAAAIAAIQNQNTASTSYVAGDKRKMGEQKGDPEVLKNRELDERDEVKLWEDGYRKRYYQSKFGVDVSEDPGFCVRLGQQYVRGLCWVLAYYYQGCPSWTWYYPYHYAPFAADFSDVVSSNVHFEPESKPFRPLEQLMGVFPADSAAHVPPAWRSLMSDPESAVIDLYPCDFKVDLNGKRFEWQGVALLPFVDESRLLKALAAHEHLLTEEERRRNVTTPDRYFIRDDHPFAEVMQAALYGDNSDEDTSTNGEGCATVIDPALTLGVCGRLWPDKVAPRTGDPVPSPVQHYSCPSLAAAAVVSAFYRDPAFSATFAFPANVLRGAKPPHPSIGPNAIKSDPRDRRSFDSGAMSRIVNHSLTPNQHQYPRSAGNTPNPGHFRPPNHNNRGGNNNSRGNNYNNRGGYNNYQPSNYNNRGGNNNNNRGGYNNYQPSNYNNRGGNNNYQSPDNNRGGQNNYQAAPSNRGNQNDSSSQNRFDVLQNFSGRTYNSKHARGGRY